MRFLRQLHQNFYTGVTCTVVALAFAACQPVAPVTESAPRVQAKLLATLYISPTPNDAEQQATQLAQRPTPTPQMITPEVSPTVYVGVFLEAAANPNAEVPIMDATLVGVFENIAAAEIPCAIPINELFGTTWSQNTDARLALGCPLEDTFPFTGTVQVFERGVMYYQPSGTIWAIAPGGAVGGFYWSLPEPPVVDQTEPISAPDGLRVPTMGFGAVWQGVAGVRDALGYARLDEQQANIAYQRFEGGTLLADVTSGLVFVLVGGSTAYGPY